MLQSNNNRTIDCHSKAIDLHSIFLKPPLQSPFLFIDFKYSCTLISIDLTCSQYFYSTQDSKFLLLEYIWELIELEMFLKTTILLAVHCVCFVKAIGWSGASYWSSRYGSDGVKYVYDRESNIWWNYFYNEGHGYEPPGVLDSSCDKCKCSKGTIDCSKVPGIM